MVPEDIAAKAMSSGFLWRACYRARLLVREKGRNRGRPLPKSLTRPRKPAKTRTTLVKMAHSSAKNGKNADDPCRNHVRGGI